MTIHLWQYLLVCPLVGIAGFIDAIAGGGGLITLPAYMLAGIPVHQAIGTNKLSSSMGTTVSTINYARKGYIRLKEAIPCVISALIGSAIGSNLSVMIDEKVLKIFMLCVLPLIAYYVLKNKDLDAAREEYSQKKMILLSLPVAFAVGMYDGFYGPGTGTFLLLLLTGFAHMKLNQAAGITKVINLTTNYTSLYVFITNATVLIPLGLTAGCFGMLGNYLGSTAFAKGGSRIARPVMLLVLGIFFVKIIWEFVGAAV